MSHGAMFLFAVIAVGLVATIMAGTAFVDGASRARRRHRTHDHGAGDPQHRPPGA